MLTYEGSLARTPFFRLSNGSTRDGKEVLGEDCPYLKIVDCPLDMEAVEQLQTVTLEEDLDAEVEKVDTAGYALSVRVGEEDRQRGGISGSLPPGLQLFHPCRSMRGLCGSPPGAWGTALA